MVRRGGSGQAQHRRGHPLDGQELPLADALDAAGGDHLDAANQRQRHGELLARAVAEQEHRLRLGASTVAVRRGSLFHVIEANTGVAGDAFHAQDEGHPAVAADGGAREARQPLEGRVQRLDDHLLGVQDVVHHQAEAARADLGNREVQRG